MNNIDKVLEKYGLRSIVKLNQESIDFMTAHIAGEYKGMEELPDGGTLEDDLYRLVRYQVGSLEVVDCDLFAKIHPMEAGKKLPEWFYQALIVENNWFELKRYDVKRKERYTFEDSIRWAIQENPEDIEMFSPGFRLKYAFSQTEVFNRAIKDIECTLKKYIEVNEENESLTVMAEELMAVIKTQYEEVKNKAEYLREKADI